YAEDLAASMLATILGVDFDPNTSYDERKDIWRMSDKIVITRNITQSAVGDREGLWTSVVAAAVFAGGSVPPAGAGTSRCSAQRGGERPRRAVADGRRAPEVPGRRRRPPSCRPRLARGARRRPEPARGARGARADRPDGEPAVHAPVAARARRGTPARE